MIKNNSPDNKASKNSAIIIGAGIGGLYAAWKLCKEGFAITVLERQNIPGGFASSIPYNGYKIDLGPHYITFERNSKTTQEIIDLIGKDNVIEIQNINRFYKSYFLGKIIDGFPTISDVISKGSDMSTLTYAWDFFLARCKGYFKKNFDTAEKYFISIYGKFLYNKWCKPYLIQSFGTVDIPLTFAKERFPPIPLRRILNKLVNSSKNKQQNKKIDSEVDAKHFDCYLKNGMGTVIDKLCSEITRLGGTIIVGADVESIEHGNSKKIIKYSKDSERHELNSEIVIYSTPLKVVSRWLPNLSLEKIEVQRPSAFNSIMIFLCIDSAQLFDGWIINVFDPTVSFFRIAQQNYLSKYIAPSNKSLLSIEIRTTDNDPLWRMDEISIINTIKADLAKINILQNNKIDSFKILKFKNLYPRVGAEKDTLDDKTIEIVRSFKNEFLLGTSEIDTGRLISETQGTEDDISIGGIYSAIVRSKMLVKEILMKKDQF